MNRKLPFTYDEFKKIYSQVPRLTVDLLIKDKNGFLLILRKSFGWEGQWHLPGGTVYYQEKVEDAVHRVAREELGVDVTIEKFMRYIEYPNEVNERGFGYTVSLLFECSLPAGSTLTNDETIEFFLKVPDNTIVEQKRVLETI